LAFDSNINRTVLFGGAAAPTYNANDETWEWNGAAATWAKMSPSVKPSARYLHGMAFDTNRDVTVLFGGNQPPASDDTYEYGSLPPSYAYFDLANGKIGTIYGSTAKLAPHINGYYRASMTTTGTADSHVIKIYSASADLDNTFAGDAMTVNTWLWGAETKLGAFPTVYIPTTAASASRSADSLTYPSDFIPGYFVGNSYQRNTLAIEVRVKCQYTDTNNIGANTSRPFLCIGGNAGTASATRNHVVIHGYNQYVYASFYSNGSVTERYMRHTVTNANQWHTYKLTLDFTDLSAATFTKDDVAFTPGESANMSGTHDFDATNCLLRIGQTYAGSVTGFCEIDYIKIWVGTA
jgi:hypothetical protein